VSEPDFYACATLGFRQWHLSLDDAEGFAFLEGLLKYGFHHPHHRWDLEGVNRAECLHARFSPRSVPEGHGEVPGIGCSCGFYAHARRRGSNSDTTAQRAGGVVAGWGTLELHEGGFRCSVAKVLAIFAPDPRHRRADHAGVAPKVAPKKWAALEEMCADAAVPLLPPDALRQDGEVRRYAHERYLALLEEQLADRGRASGDP
jgi:hypothetical protein